MRQRHGGEKQQAVAAILHVGNHTGGALGHRIVPVPRFLILLGPVAALHVQHEAVLRLLLAPRPTQVDPPDGGGVSVGDRRQRSALQSDGSGLRCQPPLQVLEADAGAQLVADPEPFLLVGVDLVAPAGGHVLHAQQRRERLAKWGVAALAQVRPRPIRERVHVAAGAALLGLEAQEALITDRQDHLVDLVAGALVVDDGPRAELADR